MRKVLYYLYFNLSRLLKIFRFKEASMTLFRKALAIKGVRFSGRPRYIDHNVYLDPEGGLTLGYNVVISTNVIVLTHDYAYTVGLIALGKKPPTDVAVVAPVSVGDNCFIGAGAILLPGTSIGDNVIVGAGAVVKGKIDDDAIVIGNPSKVIARTSEWALKNEGRLQELTLLVDKH